MQADVYELVASPRIEFFGQPVFLDKGREIRTGIDIETTDVNGIKLKIIDSFSGNRLLRFRHEQLLARLRGTDPNGTAGNPAATGSETGGKGGFKQEKEYIVKIIKDKTDDGNVNAPEQKPTVLLAVKIIIKDDAFKTDFKLHG